MGRQKVADIGSNVPRRRPNLPNALLRVYDLSFMASPRRRSAGSLRISLERSRGISSEGPCGQGVKTRRGSKSLDGLRLAATPRIPAGDQIKGSKVSIPDLPVAVCDYHTVRHTNVICGNGYRVSPLQARALALIFRHAARAPALTLFQHEFILDVCLKNVPARLYLPAFSVRTLACQTRFRPERRAILDVFLSGCCYADSGSGFGTP
jgi:hypothetical protein